MNRPLFVVVLLFLLFAAMPAFAQSGEGQVRGRVTDETGGMLPGVSVELRGPSGPPSLAVTDMAGEYAFTGVAPGTYQLSYNLINFGSVTHRDLRVAAGAVITNNEVMHLSLNAEVVVIGKRTFTNLADMAEPAENLVGIAQLGKPGGDHREAAGRQAVHATGRSARDGAGRHHHAAQRRGEGQPVFPARLQPRPRQRLRDDRRRRAGEHGDARAQPGVLRI